VRQAHTKLAKNKQNWKILQLPEQSGKITVSELLKTPKGEKRDDMIREWCLSVWDAYRDWQTEIAYIGRGL
jgi:hypothetical protein